MADYRTAAKGGSALLEALAEQGAPARRALPREAAQLPDRARRRLVLVAAGAAPDESGAGNAMMAGSLIAFICVLVGAAFGVAGVVVGLGLGTAAVVALVRSASRVSDSADAKALAGALEPVKRLPFPVEGYDLWLASEQPIFDVTFSIPVDRALFERALRGVDPSVHVAWVDDRVARITTAPVTHAEDRTGDPTLLRKLLDVVLIPLDAEVRIEKVEMGGLCRRALPAAGHSAGKGSIGGTTAT